MFYRRRWHLIVAAVLALAAAGVTLGAGSSHPAQTPRLEPLVKTDPGERMPHARRVAVMVLENRSYQQVIGSPDAPFINRLARRGALETRFYALTHPSLPNYIALTTGATGGISQNCSSCSSDRLSLVNQLDAAGISWGAYFESMPTDKDIAVTKKGPYNKNYNPFVFTESLNRRRDQSRLKGFSHLRRDLARRDLSRFTWIAPNTRHDGHRHPLRAADAYAARVVPKVLRALGPRGVLYLTWDEGNRDDHTGIGGTRGGGHIVLIAAGGLARRHARVAVPATHVALLRTIESNLGRPPLPGTAASPVLGGLLRR